MMQRKGVIEADRGTLALLSASEAEYDYVVQVVIACEEITQAYDEIASSLDGRAFWLDVENT